MSENARERDTWHEYISEATNEKKWGCGVRGIFRQYKSCQEPDLHT